MLATGRSNRHLLAYANSRLVALTLGAVASDSMSEYEAVVEWAREGVAFTDNRYSRGHRWLFDGGIEVPASSSPSVVPLPLSVAAAVDPEEAFVASLSSCHMLVFLSIAAKRGFVVDSYRDKAVGVLAKDSSGKLAMTRVTLRPKVEFVGDKRPAPDELAAMHETSHEQCFIASSVKTDVQCEPVGTS
jgi:organic hydroperoxide reductase OsmC/OhrA